MRLGYKVAMFGLGLAMAPAMGSAQTLTLYSAQHEQVVDMLAGMFTKQTGIKVAVREGEGPEVAAQIIQEGADSPADVFFTENSPELILLDEKGLLAPVDKTTLARIPAAYNATDGNWVGVLARENVIAFNPSVVPESAMPASLMDFAKPAWQGKIGIAPSDADFLPLVSAVIRLEGKEKAAAWLAGLKANAKVYQDEEGLVAAVSRGTVAAGIVNNYYWDRLEQSLGAANVNSKVHHFTDGDVGGLVNVSGAAVVKASKNQEAAQKFLAFLVSAPAQIALGESDVDFEYPLRPGVAPNPKLRPFKELHPPVISVSALGDDQDAGLLLQQAGLI